MANVKVERTIDVLDGLLTNIEGKEEKLREAKIELRAAVSDAVRWLVENGQAHYLKLNREEIELSLKWQKVRR